MVLRKIHLGVGACQESGLVCVPISTLIFKSSTWGTVGRFSVGTKIRASGRHEAVDLQNIFVSRFLACDWKRIRLVMQKTSARSVVLGATVSPAWFHDRDVDGNSTCLWCSSLGAWDHLCWCCPASPLERPVCPRDALLRRFGWLRERDPTEILNYLAQVQQMIWDHRYRSG